MSQQASTQAAASERQTQIPEHLFTPLGVGAYCVPHRIVMAPLTRSRARQPGQIPMEGQGYAWTPGSAALVPSAPIGTREEVLC